MAEATVPQFCELVELLASRYDTPKHRSLSGWAWAPDVELSFLRLLSLVERSTDSEHEVLLEVVALKIRRWLAWYAADQQRQAEACEALGIGWPPPGCVDRPGVDLDDLHQVLLAIASFDALRMVGSEQRPWIWPHEGLVARLDGGKCAVYPSDWTGEEQDDLGFAERHARGEVLVVRFDEVREALLRLDTARRGRPARIVPPEPRDLPPVRALPPPRRALESAEQKARRRNGMKVRW